MAPIGTDREVTFPAGSGPTDGRVGTLKDLADLLATWGIAPLRYDDGGHDKLTLRHFS
ncbi:hypothetical protein ACQPXS_01745 [Streptomyces sp. CA-142005]|uniref:hypothetical protein n=1 Tax=Streptomyces sp. CA-142005 TaxID=3240052 RepID=UPI003D93DDE8